MASKAARRTPTMRVNELRALWWLVKFWAIVALAFILLIVVVTHPGAGSKPAPAACPPSECTFHPHAPHGPTP